MFLEQQISILEWFPEGSCDTDAQSANESSLWAPAPLRFDGKVPFESGAPLRCLPRVAVFDMTIFDRGR